MQSEEKTTRTNLKAKDSHDIVGHYALLLPFESTGLHERINLPIGLYIQILFLSS